MASGDFCGAVAVSAHPPFHEFKEAVSLLRSYSVKTNLHFVLNAHTLPQAIKWLTEIPVFLRDLNAIIFLAYKPVGRKANDSLVLKSGPTLGLFFKLIESHQFPFKIGFDSCSVSGIVSHTEYDDTLVEPCEAGRFSAFVSEEMRMYPCSFMVQSVEGECLRSTTMKDIWQNSQSFNRVREKLKTNDCGGCHHYENCMGGCPVFDQITMCREDCRESKHGCT
jgi:radical SAM protein with 4Fe4S-binding SPASM domain